MGKLNCCSKPEEKLLEIKDEGEYPHDTRREKMGEYNLAEESELENQELSQNTQSPNKDITNEAPKDAYTPIVNNNENEEEQINYQEINSPNQEENINIIDEQNNEQENNIYQIENNIYQQENQINEIVDTYNLYQQNDNEDSQVQAINQDENLDTNLNNYEEKNELIYTASDQDNQNLNNYYIEDNGDNLINQDLDADLYYHSLNENEDLNNLGNENTISIDNNYYNNQNDAFTSDNGNSTNYGNEYETDVQNGTDDLNQYFQNENDYTKFDVNNYLDGTISNNNDNYITPGNESNVNDFQQETNNYNTYQIQTSNVKNNDVIQSQSNDYNFSFAS